MRQLKQIALGALIAIMTVATLAACSAQKCCGEKYGDCPNCTEKCYVSGCKEDCKGIGQCTCGGGSGTNDSDSSSGGSTEKQTKTVTVIYKDANGAELARESVEVDANATTVSKSKLSNVPTNYRLPDNDTIAIGDDGSVAVSVVKTKTITIEYVVGSKNKETVSTQTLTVDESVTSISESELKAPEFFKISSSGSLDISNISDGKVTVNVAADYVSEKDNWEDIQKTFNIEAPGNNITAIKNLAANKAKMALYEKNEIGLKDAESNFATQQSGYNRNLTTAKKTYTIAEEIVVTSEVYSYEVGSEESRAIAVGKAQKDALTKLKAACAGKINTGTVYGYSFQGMASDATGKVQEAYVIIVANKKS